MRVAHALLNALLEQGLSLITSRSRGGGNQGYSDVISMSRCNSSVKAATGSFGCAGKTL